MTSRALAVIAIGSALSVGCRKAGGSSAGTAQTATSTRAAAAPTGNACDRRLVSKDDVTGILRDPIVTMKSLAADGDPQSCAFETAGFASVTISLRPGLGNATVDTWSSGRMPASATPLSGVGDGAVWAADLKEVIATKNNLLCDIGVTGPPGASLPDEVVEKRLGDLCTKIFAR